MRPSFPASIIHRRLLGFRPKRNHCLRQRELHALRNMSGSLVYLWLQNGSGFWYQIYSARGNTLYGYRLDRQTWRWMPIELHQICSYY